MQRTPLYTWIMDICLQQNYHEANTFLYHNCYESWVLPFQILRFGVIHRELICSSNFCIAFNDSCSLCPQYFCSTDSFTFTAIFNYFNNLAFHLSKKHYQILPLHTIAILDNYVHLWNCNITVTKISCLTQNRFLIFYGHASVHININYRKYNIT